MLKRTGIVKSDDSASRSLIIEPTSVALNVNKTDDGSRPEASYPVVLSRARDIYTRYLSLDVERMRKNMALWGDIVSPARQDEPKDAENATFWIQEQVNKAMQESDCDTAFVQTEIFASKHNNTGPSLITRLQGRSNKTIVVGASQHRGADANGAGAMVNLEVLRVLLTKIHLRPDTFENTIEFHWYGSRLKNSSSRESDGSAEIWAEYQRTDRDIWAILEQNLISYSLEALNAGAPESFVITKNEASAPLVGFVRSVIRTVSRQPVLASFFIFSSFCFVVMTSTNNKNKNNNVDLYPLPPFSANHDETKSTLISATSSMKRSARIAPVRPPHTTLASRPSTSQVLRAKTATPTARTLPRLSHISIWGMHSSMLSSLRRLSASSVWPRFDFYMENYLCCKRATNRYMGCGD